MGKIIATFFGFLLIFVGPYGHGYFRDWLIPLGESYRISLFEAFAIPIAYCSLIYYGIRIRKSEQFLFLSIIGVILSRILSLLAAEIVQIEQWVSIFRYVEALILIYIFANLFSEHKNRNFFIIGIIIGVAIETIGGIFVHLNTNYKGVFVSNTSFILQTFLIIACILTFMNGRHKFLMVAFILTMIVSILTTLTRTAWLFLMMTMLIFVLIYFKKRVLRSVLILIVLTGIIILSIGRILPYKAEIFDVRYRSAFIEFGGSVLYRLYLWDKGIAAFLQNPIFGIGSGGFARQMDDLPSVFQVTLPKYYADLELKVRAHNLFVGVLSETGIIGLGAYFLWIIAVIYTCKRGLKLSNIHLSHDKYVISASLILISSTISDLISEYSFTPISNTFIGFVCGWLRGKHKINKINTNKEKVIS